MEQHPQEVVQVGLYARVVVGSRPHHLREERLPVLRQDFPVAVRRGGDDVVRLGGADEQDAGPRGIRKAHIRRVDLAGVHRRVRDLDKAGRRTCRPHVGEQVGVPERDEQRLPPTHGKAGYRRMLPPPGDREVLLHEGLEVSDEVVYEIVVCQAVLQIHRGDRGSLLAAVDIGEDDDHLFRESRRLKVAEDLRQGDLRPGHPVLAVKEAMQQVERAIVVSLRMGDVTTQYSSFQYVTLLMNANEDDSRAIAQRIILTWQEVSEDKYMTLTYDLKNIVPK